jgi:poly(A) polymerase
MLDHDILRPVLPEIERPALERLDVLVRAEAEAGLPPDPLRRLASLVPQDREVAGDIAARLKLSNKAQKRLGCAAGAVAPRNAQSFAYFAGLECAIDRLLLSGEAERAKAIRQWVSPRLPIGGGALIERGLKPGPVVAKTLQSIERRWVEAGFPAGEDFERLVAEEVTSARG